MNQRNQYDHRGSRQGNRPEEMDRSRARSGRSMDEDSPRYYGSGARDDFDESGEYDGNDGNDCNQYLGSYPSGRGQQYYNAPRQPVRYGQPHDPPGLDAEPYDHPAGGQRQFGAASQGAQRYWQYGQSNQQYSQSRQQYGQPRGGAYYGGAYGPEDFRQGSGRRQPQGQYGFAGPQREFRGRGGGGGQSTAREDYGRGYDQFRQQRYPSGYGTSHGGFARDYDEGDYDQAYGGYSPSQHGFGDSWSGYGRGGYGSAFGQDVEQDLMGTTNSTVGSGGFNQGQATQQRQGYGRGYYGGGYSQGLAGRGGFGSPDYGDEYETGRRQSQFGKGPKGYVRSDERLKEDLSEKLMRDHAIDASDINVEVRSGVVTLTGSVNDRRLKHYAEDMAEACSGVKDVDNRLTVRQRGSESSASASSTHSAGSRGVTPSTASGGTTPGSGSPGGSTGDDATTTRKN